MLPEVLSQRMETLTERFFEDLGQDQRVRLQKLFHQNNIQTLEDLKEYLVQFTDEANTNVNAAWVPHGVCLF